MIKDIFNTIQITQSITRRLFLQASRRDFSSSCVVSKKYKYALDKKKQQPSLNNFSGCGKRQSRGPKIVEGKALTYFQFADQANDTDSEFHEPDSRSPKQLAYAEIVRTAVESLLAAKTNTKEIQDIVIEIVDVEVSSSLTSAFIVWRIPKGLETKYSKKETEDIIEKNIPYLRSELPAHSTVTQTPAINFVYDIFSEKQEELDTLFARIRDNP